MVKIKKYINPERNNKWNNDNDDIVINSSDEAKICLNCPYPKCNKSGKCKYYEEEIKKIKKKRNAVK